MLSPGAVVCADFRSFDVMRVLIENDNGRTVQVHLGESLQLRLSENATAGYRWEIDRNEGGALEFLGTQPYYTAGNVGSGGEVVFIFQSRKAGIGDIELKHWRQWEGEDSVTVRFRVRILVLP